MLIKEEAIKIAANYVNELNQGSKHEFVLTLDKTIEFDLGWVFFYQTALYIKTGDIMHMAIGNAPIVIDKLDGSIHETGTAHPIEYYIAEYLENYKENGRK
jgi:hypothetical protein